MKDLKPAAAGPQPALWELAGHERNDPGTVHARSLRPAGAISLPAGPEK